MKPIMPARSIVASITLVFAAAGLTACAGERTRDDVVSRDTQLTARVQAELLRDPALQDAPVKVEAHAGSVVLTGQVGDATQVARAGRVARAVEGVTAVTNALRVSSR